MKSKSPNNFRAYRLNQLTRYQKARYLSVISLLLVVGLLASVGFALRSNAASAPPPQTPLAAQSTVVNYNFNSGNSYPALTPILASGITCSATSTQPFLTASPGTATDTNAFTANTVPGVGLAMADTSGTNTKYFQFQLGGASLSINWKYKVYVQALRTANAATTLTLAYSTDGVSFTNLPDTMSPGLFSFTSKVFDLSGIAALNHKNGVTFRLLASGASSSSLGVVIDNFQVQAETVTCPGSVTVNSTADTSDADPGDGLCDDGTGNCTLRAALEEANSLPGCGTLDVNLRVHGAINLASELPTITRSLNLNGPGANILSVTGNSTFRLLNILLSTAGTVNFNDLSFTRGGKNTGANAAAIEFNNNGTLNLNRVELFNNSGEAGSGVIFSNASAGLNLNGCTIRNNAVEHVLFIGNTPFAITNSTISNNTGTGAGVFVFGGTLNSTITSSTITNNNQGLWHVNTTVPSTVTIRNSIFSQNGNINLRRTGSGTCAQNGILSDGYNLIDNDPGSNLCTSFPTDLIGTSFNPQLSTLGSYGGTTQTRVPQMTSPVIDQGKAFGLAADQRGGGRSRNFANIPNANDGTDIGAVEVEIPLVVNSLADTFDITANGVCDDGAGNCTLRAALQEANFMPGGDTITFAPNMTGAINLGSSLPPITEAVTLRGPGANSLTITGNDTFRLVNIHLSTQGVVDINDLSFSRGFTSAGTNGAAIEFNDVGTLNLNRLEFFYNSGPAGSGVIYSNAAVDLNLNGCTLRNNFTVHVLHIGNTSFQISNSTISNNTGTGAAVFVDGNSLNSLIASSTITNNNHGLWALNASGLSTVMIRSSIFSQNSINLRRTGPGSCATNGILSEGYNLVDNDPGSSLCGSTATDLIGSSFNPQLLPLGYYGGAIQTRLPQPASPVIDKGKAFDLSVDQRGTTRTRDLQNTPNASGGDGTDIGAVELSLVVNSLDDTGDASPDGICDDGAGNCTLREALQEANFMTVSNTISFAPGLIGAINLGSSLPTITRPVTILGPGASLLIVSGNSTFRLLNILLSTPGTVTISDLSFFGGFRSAGVNAAAIEFNDVGLLNLNRLEFFNNSGPFPSSVIYSNAALGLNLNGCTLRDNSTPFVIITETTPFNISNSTISNNTNGATAIFIGGAASNNSINSSTITQNNRGLWHDNDAGSSTVTIRNSIFSQNVLNLQRSGPGTCAENGILSDGYNLFDQNPGGNLCTSTATDLIGPSFNPRLTPLAYYGGQTQTRALLAGSPAIDKGNSFGLTTDQRGQTRAFDDPSLPAASGGDQSDIGAVELGAACNAITLTPETLPNWNTSGAYNQTLTATGGTAPYTFRVVSGTLPSGLSLSTSGSFSGHPDTAGTFIFTVLATDSSGCYGLHAYSVNISNCTTISLSPTSLPNGTPGVAYSQLLNASGGSAPYSFSFTGSLPNGLSLANDGNLTGTPTTPGVFNFSVAATSNFNGCRGIRSYQVAIASPPTNITLSSSTVAENSASGTPVGNFSSTDPDSSTFTYSLVAGTGDDDNASFAISGNQLLTNAVFDFETKSSYNIRVRSQDETSLSFEKQFVISVTNVNEAPAISSILDQTVTSGGNTGALGFTISDPDTATDALSVTGVSDNPVLVPTDAAHISLSGTGSNRFVTVTTVPQQVGVARITITVSDGTLSASDEFEVRVNCSSLSLSSLRDGLIHTSYTQTITASGGSGSYTFVTPAATLPPGLSLSPSGLLAGEPTATGTFSFDVIVTDTNTGCTGSRHYQLVIGDVVTAGQVIISEFRFHGSDPDGAGPLTAAANEYLEFYNNTSTQITVSTADGSAGWALAASDGQVKFVIPNGAVIPAHGHFLAVNTSGYGLTGAASGDSLLLADGVTRANGYLLDIGDNAGAALFNNNTTFTAATRLDAVGFANVANGLYREGAGLDPAAGITVDGETAFVRRFVGDLYCDTDTNAADFLFLSTDADVYNGRQSLLGAASPQNVSSPLNRNSSILIGLLDPVAAAALAPNRVRDLTSNPAGNATFGTISIRRRVTNNTGLPVTQLRFRVTDITALPVPNAGTADVRAITSADVPVTLSNQSVVQVMGTTLTAPPSQNLGGGLNATFVVGQTVTLSQPIAPGASIDLQFMLGVQKTGAFRFYINVEALN